MNWINIKESLPELRKDMNISKDLVVYNHEGIQFHIRLNNSFEFRRKGSFSLIYRITHWMYQEDFDKKVKPK